MTRNKIHTCVSVVMAAYNEERHIGKAIQSIIEQSFFDWELIIIDDGSQDGTVEVIQTFAKGDTRIILLQNESNIGLPASLNRGITLSQGEYVARADADDINLFDRFEKQYKFMIAHPDVDVLGTGAYLLDESGNRVNIICPPQTHDELKKLGFSQTIFFHPSVMIRKRFFEQAGLYDVSFARAQDKELWLRGLRNGCQYANLSEPLIEYRTNGYSRSWKSIRDKTMSSLMIAKKHKVRHGYSLACLSFMVSVSVKLGLWRPRSLKRGWL